MTEATTPGLDRSASTSAIPLREEVSSDAARLAQTAKERLDQAAEGQKETAVGVARSATSAIDRAASALREDQGAPEWLSKAFETTARQIETLAGSVEGKNFDELRRNVSQFARQSPIAFLAASAAAGFAAARFLRAGSEYKAHQPQPAQGSGGADGSTSYGDDASSANWSGGSAQGDAVGSATGAELSATGSSSSIPSSDQTVWSPGSTQLDREGVVS